ncbi:hypothetical protein LM500008_120076 [Listeria monocytogenes]|nr:hypothetical protein LM500008_120076 [Listeria monocytogenes]CUK36331.1 hypothetical protein LM500172_110130 [Listeria monocytogenes]
MRYSYEWKITESLSSNDRNRFLHITIARQTKARLRDYRKRRKDDR